MKVIRAITIEEKWNCFLILIKVLGRNKDKLATELKQSKELIQLIKKSTTQELSKEEKDLVKTLFLDIVKSMPSLAIFMLPGGALLLPLVLKIIPDLVPSAFRENEIDKEWLTSDSVLFLSLNPEFLNLEAVWPKCFSNLRCTQTHRNDLPINPLVTI